MSKELTRRDFLKGAAAAAVGGAFFGFGAPVKASAATYTPGTYTATANGINGPVTVTAPFNETSIIDIVLDVSGAAAGDALRAQILDAQGPQIDGVSGASITSNAVKTALADCINQAGGNVVIAELEPAPAAEEPTDIKWPQCEPAYTPVAAGEGKIAYELDPIDPALVIDERDVDVLVCGLGPAGYAAALSCAQHGLKTVAIEKNDTGTINSSTIGGLTDRIHKMYGVEFDAEEWIGEAMTKNGYRANQDLYRQLVNIQEEAVNWWLDQMPFKDEDYNIYRKLLG